MAMSLRVVVPPHPLIANWLTLLRDRHTPDPLFATAMAELGRWLTYEAVRDWLPQQAVDVETPLARTQGTIVDPEVPVLAVPILPAGLGLWQGGQPVLPGARVALLAPAAGGEGWALDTLPAAIGERVGVLVYVPVVASGRTLLAVLERLRALGVSGPRLRVITSVAAAPGLKLIGEKIADLTLYCSCIDAELDGEGRLLPGFGDPQRRLHGIGAAGCLG
ncbi:uracil phosphoribosyltransferase [Cyanobium sp. FGCU-52]|nr:uracil phosphoribosyltransferase [Cyanobium sp. FGCU52]